HLPQAIAAYHWTIPPRRTRDRSGESHSLAEPFFWKYHSVVLRVISVDKGKSVLWNGGCIPQSISGLQDQDRKSQSTTCSNRERPGYGKWYAFGGVQMKQ